MSPETLAVIFGGILAVLAAAAVIIRFLRIGSIGPIKMEHRGQTTMRDMYIESKKIEDACQREMRRITGGLKINISNIFAEHNICILARIAITTALRYPLYDAVSNNHFAFELTYYYDAYRESVIEQIREEYISLSIASKNNRCNSEELNSWEEISELLTGCIDIWLRNISRESLRTFERQITIYNRYLTEFEAVKDSYRVELVKKEIKNNEQCVTLLKARLRLGFSMAA